MSMSWPKPGFGTPLVVGGGRCAHWSILATWHRAVPVPTDEGESLNEMGYSEGEGRTMTMPDARTRELTTTPHSHTDADTHAHRHRQWQALPHIQTAAHMHTDTTRLDTHADTHADTHTHPHSPTPHSHTTGTHHTPLRPPPMPSHSHTTHPNHTPHYVVAMCWLARFLVPLVCLSFVWRHDASGRVETSRFLRWPERHQSCL